ncbi:MAG: hypothetical protein MZV70_67020 [Desulfobacterales bacterium]|nr:hypothetical protein [Desulfobacterales bacterium]
MNLHNPTEVHARVGYYGVTYVPWSVLDGNFYLPAAPPAPGHKHGEYPVRRSFALHHAGMQALLNAAEDTIFVTMVAQSTMDISGS